MKESGFVKQNISKWKDFESELIKKQRDPQKVSRLFIQITDDLSYAQTFYKNRSVRVYLNSIAQILLNSINRNSRIRVKALWRFWNTELPVIMYNTRREFLLSFIFFVICIGVGVLSSIYEPEFARNILGDQYIDMTIENIENDDPMAVYKKMNEVDMFLGITVNNLRVAFRTFMSGLFIGFGTLFSLLNNGIMLGTFQYFFIERGLFWESFLTIWQHGTLEIASIIIAGGAGLVLGKGLIFPGTYTRAQSLRIAAKRGLKIMIGVTPVFILAAFIEGFFTRYTEAPDILRLVSIILSLSFILIYFVYYPRQVVQRNPERIDVADNLTGTQASKPDFKKIQSHVELFGNSLKLFKDVFLKTLFFIVVSIILICVLELFIMNSASVDSFSIILNRYGQLLNYTENHWLFFVHSISLGLFLALLVYAFNCIKSEQRFSIRSFFAGFQKRIISTMIISFSLNLVFLLSPGWGSVLFITLLPFLLLALYISNQESLFLFTALSRMLRLLRHGFGKFLWLYLRFLFLSFLILLLLNPGLYWNALSVVRWHLVFSENWQDHIISGIVLFISLIGFITSLYLIGTSMANLYYTLTELNEANNLLEKISKIGTRKTIKGYEVD